MRVLIVNCGMYTYGGAELVIVKLANYMTKKGIKTALLTTSIIPEMAKDLHETEVIVKKSALKLSPFNDLLSLHKGIHENLGKYDLINVHNYPAELSTFPFHKPVVWMCNEPVLYLLLRLEVAPRIRAHMRYLINRSLFTVDRYVFKYYVRNAVVADEFNRDRFVETYGFEPDIINYGIDYEFFSKGNRSRALEKFGLADSFIVLHVGMLTPFKNQIESIRTVDRLKRNIPNIKLLLAGWGSGEWEMKMRQYVKERELDQDVIFTGHLSREDLRDLYHACDVLIHPIKPQGGWLAPFEALCAGKTIVVSEEMTASNIIKREKIGAVTDDFAETIWDIYLNPQKYKEAAERGQKWVRENLGWEKFCEKMVNVFCKAMEES